MAEPTSVLTFNDLILKVAKKLGLAYFGANSDEVAQIPIDAHDLAECKAIVNDALRMFIHDGPKPNGWRWLRPVASLSLWPSVAVSSTNKVLTAVFAAGVTTLTVTSAAFYPSMERKSIVITAIGTFTITEYVSTTSVKVSGDASAAHAANKTFSVTADGNYTLPLNFGGQHLGPIFYAASTSRGMSLEWCDEGSIRAWRQESSSDSGTPWKAAIRIMDNGSPRRRWELMTYPVPSELLVVEFPYQIHFDSMTALTEVQPAPFGHDETVLAACLAKAEKDKNDALGIDWDYYRNTCLPNSYRVDAASAPRKLETRRGPRSITDFRDNWYQRPDVTFNP
jgi:hypothetical protein